MKPAETNSSHDQSEKIARRVKLEFDSFKNAWHGVQEKKIGVEELEGQHLVEMEQQGREIEQLDHIVTAVQSLCVSDPSYSAYGADGADGSDGVSTASEEWQQKSKVLEELQERYLHAIERYDLGDAAVAAIVPRLKATLEGCNLLEEPCPLVDDLKRLKPLLGMTDTKRDLVEDGLSMDPHRRHKDKWATTPYETMMHTIWLPKVRSVVANWDVRNTDILTAFVESWRPLLPSFVHTALFDQIIVPRLTVALQEWQPRPRSRHSRTVEPQRWIFPWLQHLPDHHLDPKSQDGLLAQVKRRLGQILSRWHASDGILPDLQDWHRLLGPELDQILLRNLLPRLSSHLSHKLEINPTKQDLQPLEDVLAWSGYFKPNALARLLVAKLFPKWLSTLHRWLTVEDADFDKIGEWFTWWQKQLPRSLSDHPEIQNQWEIGTNMISDALDLIDKSAPMNELPPPPAVPEPPLFKSPKKSKSPASAPADAAQQPNFKDVVEDWCANEGLHMAPLREAHQKTGLPLFRITASASGRGGVIVYFQDDVVWAQHKGNRSAYEMIGLGDELVSRAGGK
ncbi:TFP11-domain-containing protein [Piedraia hortae CBS 480.64]|uniref:TFP11-domain-containing protein n=1 Tax=Piedraia hortae CBS 480.64 TaxID=1314780 RepID=A0A6A7C080_9PEZI|nr:TFP11-domain-containing protein [Piedraia hortae CBS 480.64]